MQMTTTVAQDIDFNNEANSGYWMKAFLACIESFPTPANKSRGLYLYLRGNYADLEKAASLIGLDPFLSVEVIRSANTATYGCRGTDSLLDAVNAIGLERLSRIALRIWLKNFLPRSLRSYYLDGGDFVHRSVACGAAMRYMYQGDSGLAETAYAVGLLHSIGRVVIDEAVRRSGDSDIKFCQRTTRTLAEAEKREFGTTHAVVGGLALEFWGFSKAIYEPVSQQFANVTDTRLADWTQSLAIARFTADRVLEVLNGHQDPLRGEGRAVYKGKTLSDIYEFTLAMTEQEILSDMN